MNLSQVCSWVEGELVRDGQFEVLEQCTAECKRPFLTYMENVKFLDKINPNATCVLCPKSLQTEIEARYKDMGILVVEEPRKSFFEIHNAVIDEKRLSFPTKVGKNCKISTMSVIAKQGVIMGDNVIVEDFVQINPGTIIGNDCIIHSHVAIASKSYTFVKGKDGDLIGVKDGGSVEIGNNVEIFPFVNVASGVLEVDVTKIGDGTKIDALVHVGHGVKIGKDCKIIAGTQIGGNSVIGDNSTLGINSTISNRLNIGENAKVSLGSVVTQNVDDNSTVTGNFAVNHELFLKNLKKSINGQ